MYQRYLLIKENMYPMLDKVKELISSTQSFDKLFKAVKQ